MVSFKVRPEDQESFDKGETEVIQRWWHPAKGDVVFDIGCGSGLYSLPAMAAGAFVYAFDPDPQACLRFQDNVLLNGFTQMNYIFRNVALGAENNDSWSIRDAWLNMGMEFSVIEDYVSRLDAGGRNVTLRTLDSFERNTMRLDWMKIDVEGFELDVLQGAMGLLKWYHPRMIIENHSFVDNIGPWMRSNGIWPKILLFLKEVGYDPKKMEEVDHEGRSHLYCE